MRFTFSQVSMMKGLQRVMGAIATRVPMPSLSNLQMKLEGKKLEITATDLDTTITAHVDLIDAEGSGGVLVQAKRFQELIRELPDVPLEVNVPDDGKVLLGGEGVGNYILPGGDPVEFPELPPVDAKVTFTIKSEDLRRMVSKTLFAVSNDEMRPVLTGILMQVRSEEMRMVATDGHRLSKIIHKNIAYSGEPIDVIVPMKALNLVMRNLQDDDEPEIALAESRASFSTKSQRLVTRLIDGHYPRYESVIPEANPGKMTLRTEDLMSAVRRVSIFASQISRQIRLKIDSTSIQLESEDQELGGKADEIVSVSYDADPMEIAYNASYLMDVLKQVDTEDAIFEMGADDDAAIVKPTAQEENEEFIMLLMPIRLK